MKQLSLPTIETLTASEAYDERKPPYFVVSPDTGRYVKCIAVDKAYTKTDNGKWEHDGFTLWVIDVVHPSLFMRVSADTQMYRRKPVSTVRDNSDLL